MNLTMPILEKNDTWLQHRLKLIEEAIELHRAIINKDKSNIAEEALDVIQICMGILDKLSEEGIDIAQEIENHNEKLSSRAWKFKRIIAINLINKGFYGEFFINRFNKKI